MPVPGQFEFRGRNNAWMAVPAASATRPQYKNSAERFRNESRRWYRTTFTG